MTTRKKTFHLTVNPADAPARLDRFLSSRMDGYSRSFLQKLIDDKMVTVNGLIVRRSFLLSADDRITVTIPPPQETVIQAEDIPLDIVFEDQHMLVVNKPAGLVVHPGAGVHSGTLVNALMYHCQDLSGVGGRLRPGIVHRLDKNTSGLVAVAKNDTAHISLQKQFSEKSAGRDYYALVWGTLREPEGTIDTYINRSKSDRKKFAVSTEGKNAISNYKVVEPFSFLTLLSVALKTGRTHQIRVHCKHIGHPVFGDAEYNGRNSQLGRLSALSDRNFAIYLLNIMKRQALHAYRLVITHPVSREKLVFEADVPRDYKLILDKIQLNEGA